MLCKSTTPQGTLIAPIGCAEVYMVCQSKILVLDEGGCFISILMRNSTSRYLATSAVDLDTDRAIQEIIRGPAFTDVTIFTIALVLSFLCFSTCD